MRSPQFDLMIISDERPSLLARFSRALEGAPPGRIAVQLRERSLPARALLELARELRALTRACGARLLINGRVDVAIAAEADGVQLPELGLPILDVRRLVGPDFWIGASRHDFEGLRDAADQGADYATLSPIGRVEGKATPLGIDGFAAIVREVRLPVYALGGVRQGDVRALRAAGARGIAVIREVLEADRPALSVERLLSELAAPAL